MPSVVLFLGKRIIASLLVLLCLLAVFVTFVVSGDMEAAQGDVPLLNYAPSIYKPEPTPTPIPPPDQFILQPYASGFDTDAIVFIVNAGDSRLFVGEQEGQIQVVDGSGDVEGQPFLDITGQVRHTNWEEGLLGMVFHPDYANNGFFYVSYNVENPGHFNDGAIRVSRFEVSDDDNVADPNNELVLLEINKPYDPEVPFSNISPVHNAGDMHFGPDGYLYIAAGDGGPDPEPQDPDPGDPNNNGQRLDTLLGKILRIDVNSTTGIAPDCGALNKGLGDHYTIPPDNPFVTGFSGVCDEIWAYGLRNPWRFSFDRLTGDMYISDVGEWLREEVNFQPAGSPGGQNYGWRCWEGSYDHRSAPHLQGHCPEESSGTTFPIFEYDSAPSFCSVVGGYVYRGTLMPRLQGHYLVTDLDCGSPPSPPPPTLCGPGGTPFWALKRDGNGQWSAVAIQPNIRPCWTTFGEDDDGELYIASYDPGNSMKTIYQLTAP